MLVAVAVAVLAVCGAAPAAAKTRSCWGITPAKIESTLGLKATAPQLTRRPKYRSCTFWPPARTVLRGGASGVTVTVSKGRALRREFEQNYKLGHGHLNHLGFPAYRRRGDATAVWVRKRHVVLVVTAQAPVAKVIALVRKILHALPAGT